MTGAQSVQLPMAIGLSAESLTAQWLVKKMISPMIAAKAGVRFTPTKIAYPRVSMLDQSLLGWKVRDLQTGKTFQEPRGIQNNECEPFTVVRGPLGVVICEGESDALCAASNLWFLSGYTIVGVPGSSSFVPEWASLYSWADEVYVVPDADKAGEQLASSVGRYIPRAVAVRLPDGSDLCDEIRRMSDIQGMFKTAIPTTSTQVSIVRSDDFDSGVNHSALLTFVLMDTDLRRRGIEMVGLCPFHDENTPSFSVNTKKNLYNCFGCNRGGDVISYIRERYGVDFNTAKGMANG